MVDKGDLRVSLYIVLKKNAIGTQLGGKGAEVTIPTGSIFGKLHLPDQLAKKEAATEQERYEDVYMKNGTEFIKLSSSACQQVYLGVADRLSEEKRRKKEEKKRLKEEKRQRKKRLKNAKAKALAVSAFGAFAVKPGKPTAVAEGGENVEDGEEGADEEDEGAEGEDGEGSSDDSDDSDDSDAESELTDHAPEIYVARPIKRGVPMRRIIQGSLIKEAIRASINEQIPSGSRADFFSARNKKRCYEMKQPKKRMTVGGSSPSLPSLTASTGSSSPQKTYKQDKRAERIKQIRKQLQQAKNAAANNETSRLRAETSATIQGKAGLPESSSAPYDLRARLQAAHERSIGIPFQDQIEQTQQGPTAQFGRMAQFGTSGSAENSVYDLESAVFRLGLGYDSEFQ
jgi:hypothetical protein